LGKEDIIIKFNDQTFALDNQHYSDKEYTYKNLSSTETLIEVNLSANEAENHNSSEMNILRPLIFLMFSIGKKLPA
jgi:hypothetical protein